MFLFRTVTVISVWSVGSQTSGFDTPHERETGRKQEFSRILVLPLCNGPVAVSAVRSVRCARWWWWKAWKEETRVDVADGAAKPTVLHGYTGYPALATAQNSHAGDVSAADVCDGIVRTRVRRERESGALCRKRAEGEPETVTGQPSLASDAVIRSHVFAGQGCQRVRNRPVSFVDTQRKVPARYRKKKLTFGKTTTAC